MIDKSQKRIQRNKEDRRIEGKVRKKEIKKSKKIMACLFRSIRSNFPFLFNYLFIFSFFIRKQSCTFTKNKEKKRERLRRRMSKSINFEAIRFYLFSF